MKNKFKKILNKYFAIGLLVIVIISLIIYLIYSSKYTIVRYENAAGDRYKITLTMKDKKAVKADVVVKFKGKNKEKQAKYTYDLLIEQPEKYKDVKIKDNKVEYVSLKEMALKKDKKTIRRLYNTSLYLKSSII